jgi:hypothetical protein
VMMTVAQLVEALRYKPEGRGFDSPMVPLEFLTLPASNRNEYQEYFLGVGRRVVIALPPSYADCLELW